MSDKLKASIDARARNLEAVRLECRELLKELAELCAKDERAMHVVIALRVRLTSQAADICGILADTAVGRMIGQFEQRDLDTQREMMRRTLRRVADDSLDEDRPAKGGEKHGD